MDPLSTAIISKALDGLTMRSEAIAQNIANANSPSYRPVAVDFEQSLRAAAEQGVDAVRAVEPELKQMLPGVEGEGTRLDLEMASASATALRYSALVDVLSRQLQIHHALLRGGQ